MFLVNSRQGYFRCGPNCLGQALFRRYGRFFAEFLGAHSLVRLALLELITCVGLRYGRHVYKFRSFSWKALHDSPPRPKPGVPHTLASCIKADVRICQDTLASSTDVNPIRRCHLFPPSLRHYTRGVGILTYCPSLPAFAISLGPTNPSLITVEKETLIFRRAGISPALRLLVPAFSLPNAPLWLTPWASLRWERSLTAWEARRHYPSPQLRYYV